MSLASRIKRVGFGFLSIAISILPSTTGGTLSDDSAEEMPLFVAILALLVGVAGVVLGAIVGVALVGQGINHILGK